MHVLLEQSGALNRDFLPINKGGHIFWPLNFEVDGKIILMEGKPSTRVSEIIEQILPDDLRRFIPRAF